MPYTEEEQTAIALVDIGLHAEQFMKSDIGQYVQAVAIRESDDAAASLKTVDPTDTKKIIALQLKSGIAEQALKWIMEAVQLGHQAEHQINQEEASTNG